MSVSFKSLSEYAYKHTSEEPELLQRLMLETQEKMDYPQMLCGRIEGRFLKLIVQLTGASQIIEIGTFTGYSALSLAEGLPPDGKIVTCEVDPKAAEIAKRYFSESSSGDKIEICMGPALETISKRSETFDLAFVDGDKKNYPNYYEALLPKIKKGGLLLFDNMLWSGNVLEPQDDDSLTLHSLNVKLTNDPRVESVLLTVRDGIQLVRKC